MQIIAPWIPLARGVCGVPGQGKPGETQQFLVCFYGENGWETGKMMEHGDEAMTFLGHTCSITQPGSFVVLCCRFAVCLRRFCAVQDLFISQAEFIRDARVLIA